jgi:hypothetical protein
MALHITFTTLSPDAMDSLLKRTATNESIRQMPLHKRKGARRHEEDAPDEDDDYADQDRKDRADLVDKTRPGNAPKVTPEDFPSNAMPPLPKKPSYKKAKKR